MRASRVPFSHSFRCTFSVFPQSDTPIPFSGNPISAMSGSRLPFNPPINGILEFPRSDGSTAADCRPTWTKENATPGMLNFMVPLSYSNPRHKKWRHAVGDFLMFLLPIEKHYDVDYAIVNFPEDYVLYSKPRLTSPTEHDDLHLFGARSLKKTSFRSPREFAYHACWLMMDPTLDRSNCECTYCSGTPQAELTERLGIKVDRWRKAMPRQRPHVDTTTNFQNRSPDTPLASPVELPGKVAQRELRQHPPYRAGELVWVQLRPPIRGESDSQIIDCWPCVVLEVKIRTLKVEGGLDRQPALRLVVLGTAQIADVEAFDALPYHAYSTPTSLVAYIQNNRPTNVPNNAAYDVLSNIPLFPDSAQDTRPRQVTFDQAWPAFCKALLMSFRLIDRWSLAKVSLPVSGEASSGASGGPWDAIWWGGERIYVGDLVRLHSSIIQEKPLRPLVSKNSATRTLFMTISKIQTHRPTRLSEVWLVGDLYEAVPDQELDEDDLADKAKEEPGSGVDASSLTDLVSVSSLPPPPLGFRFAPVLSNKNAFFVQLGSVAGRYYPHLVFSPVLGATRSTNGARPQALMSLSGYAPGDVCPKLLPKTHEDRQAMWGGLDECVREFLMAKWKSGGQALKPEPRR